MSRAIICRAEHHSSQPAFVSCGRWQRGCSQYTLLTPKRNVMLLWVWEQEGLCKHDEFPSMLA